MVEAVVGRANLSIDGEVGQRHEHPLIATSGFSMSRRGWDDRASRPSRRAADGNSADERLRYNPSTHHMSARRVRSEHAFMSANTPECMHAGWGVAHVESRQNDFTPT